MHSIGIVFQCGCANAADRYGEWLLEQPRSSVLTLSFKQSVPLNNKIATSELGFICDQRDKSRIVGVILIPFDGTFQNQQDVISVLIQKSSDQYDPSDLLQNWKNGNDYIFLESQDDVNELASFIKANETHGVKSVHFFFRTILMRVLKHQITSPLISRGFPTVSMRSKWHAPHLNRFSRRPSLDILDDIYVDHSHVHPFCVSPFDCCFSPNPQIRDAS